MHKKIVVVGSLNMDLVVNTRKIPVTGETVLGYGFMSVPGGKGANQAVAAARLGGNVSMIGCVGNDTFGHSLIKNLAENNVNTDNIIILDKSSSGIAVVVIKDGNNFIIVDPGANAGLTVEMLENLEELIKGSDILIAQLEIPVQTVEKAIQIAKKHNVKVILNPAPASKLSDEVLSNVDIITPNESECELLTGMPIYDVEDAKAAVLYFNRKGISQVVVTLGSKGVVYNSSNGIIHKGVPDVKVVDTTAAGDSFTGSLAFQLAEGMDIDTAVDFANAVGTLTVMKKGAQTSLPFRHEVEDLIYHLPFQG